jgi:hypothetical protein
MTEYTVHFRLRMSLRMETVEAATVAEAIRLARPNAPAKFRLVRVDHFDAGGHLVIDY